MSLLREYIHSILSEATIEVDYDGAGIIIVRDFDGEWKVLGLEDPDGGMDFAKGHAEVDEEPMETAFRETEEEASLSEGDLSFEWGEDPIIIDGHLFLYLASTAADPQIARNPETGKLEHKNIQWLSFDEMSKQALYYLKPGVSWAREKILNGEVGEGD